MQRHYVNYYKGEQLYETNRRETALTHLTTFNKLMIVVEFVLFLSNTDHLQQVDDCGRVCFISIKY
jgi:hypothetical protein